MDFPQRSSKSSTPPEYNFPDFSRHGYCIQKILGRNSTGGRVTYLAMQLASQQLVVIKQYQFAQPGSSWVGYRAYHSEIRVLRSLYSNNIPRYIDSFETSNGFCLVQEYKRAPSLAQARSFTPQEVKQIAIAILEILAYLQKQTPVVIHGDLKPENILVDESESIKAYLIDFGFARMGSGDVALSNVVKGTVGFMPPEEMFNRQLTKASDLYSLGATLICLLVNIKSSEISRLIDEKTYRLNFKHHLPPLHFQFVLWLEKMVEPSTSNRFPNALTALKELQPTPVLGGSPFDWLSRAGKSPKAMLSSLGAIAVMSTAGLGGYTYWQGREMRQLLQTNVCQNCNLRNADLAQAQLTGANLAGANLAGAYLKDSNLTQANLSGANLTHANLKGVDLTGANLENATLQNAVLVSANLEGTNLEGANLEDATLDDANLADANLKYANLLDAKFKFTRLIRANLEGANFSGTNLEGANLKDAIMPDGKKYR